MGLIFDDLSPVQQQSYLESIAERFLLDPNDSQKLSSMKALSWLYNSGQNQQFWNGFIPKITARLQEVHLSEDETLNAQQKYYIVLLGLIRHQPASEMVMGLFSNQALLETQQSIAWFLGRVKSPEGLKKLETIATDSDAYPMVREMAIYSLAEYASQDAGRVNDLLNRYHPKNKALEEVVPDNVRQAARAMTDKLQDKLHTEPDFYVNKLLKTDAEKREYKSLRDQYVQGLDKLSVAQRNMVDRALLPYRQFLPEITRRGGRHHIIRGVITDVSTYRHSFGMRIHDGRLKDSIQGVSSSSAGAVTNVNRIVSGSDNTFAHEFIHHVHQLVLNNRGDTSKIEKLYKKAMEEKRVLDYYGATNEYENLAQGGEAMDALYLNHSVLYHGLFNEGYDTGGDNNRSKLKRKDPDLHNFLESLRSIPLEISLYLLKTYKPQSYAQLINRPGVISETSNVA